LLWDIANPEHAEAAVQRIHASGGRASVLVNNAGLDLGAPAGDPEYAAVWRRVVGVNLEGTMLVTEALLPDLRATRGSVVNIASVQAFVALQGRASAYAASKGALVQYTRALAVELGAAQVRVNAIAPGFFNTQMTAGTRADASRYAHFTGRTPMGRFGDPEELVGPVLFLASSMSSFVTGAVLAVDGGLLAQ
jgi:NAD(P)-dependent dehydrogenase (short-subunit alcohol dehydrogenase family)